MRDRHIANEATAAPPERAERILIIGLDGASYDLLLPLAEQGVMPNLAAWLRTAERLDLRSTEPAITPTAWTTFLTGCAPWDHGVFDYRYLDRRRRQLRLNDAQRVRCETLYDAVSAAGQAVVSLNLPMTWPAKPGLQGMVAGGIDAPTPAAALAGAPRLARALERQGVPYPLDLVWRRRPRSYDDLCHGVRRTAEVFAARAAAAEVADSLCDWRLMVVQFQTLDALQHRLWDLLIGEPTAIGRPGVGQPSGGQTAMGPRCGDNEAGEGATAEQATRGWVDTARQAMRALDREFGRLLELATKRGAEVMVVSDHGFGPFRQTIQLPELLSRAGLQRRASAWQQFGYRRQRIAWKLRKSWHRRVGRTGRSAAAVPRPLGALLPIDWRHSAAVTLHSNMGGLVYVNRPQRFGRGPITSTAMYDEVVEHVVAVLEGATHPKTGEPLFSTVYRVDRHVGCDPVAIDAPDVLAVPAAGFHTRSKPSRDGRLLIDDAELTGTHRNRGVWMRQSTGGTVKNGDAAGTADLCDVAPTVLARLGIAAPPSMRGRALVAGASPGPPALPRTGTSLRDVRPCGARLAEARRADDNGARDTTTETQQVEQRLRTLGYLD